MTIGRVGRIQLNILFFPSMQHVGHISAGKAPRTLLEAQKKEWFGLKTGQEEEKNKHKVPHSSTDRENEDCYISVGFERLVPMT